MNRSGTRRRLELLGFAAGLMLLAGSTFSGEIGATRYAVDLRSAPKGDAPIAAQLPEAARVDILERRGAWLQVKADGASGWLRLHQVRLGEGAEKTTSEGLRLLQNVGETGRSGASGIVATTGVRGLSAEDLKGARPDPKQVQALEAYRTNDALAREQARQANLRENNIAHLAKEEP